jgi:hypothetical protein
VIFQEKSVGAGYCFRPVHPEKLPRGAARFLFRENSPHARNLGFHQGFRSYRFHEVFLLPSPRRGGEAGSYPQPEGFSTVTGHSDSGRPDGIRRMPSKKKATQPGGAGWLLYFSVFCT